MKLSKTKLAILTVLASSKYDLSSREIFETLIVINKDFECIPSIANFLENLKNSGYIENGLSEIVNRKTVLMWRVSDTGRALIKSNNDEIVEAESPTSLFHSIENLDEKIGTLHKLLDIVPDEWVVLLNGIIDDLSRTA